MAAVLLRQPVGPGNERRVRELVADRLSERAGEGTAALLSVPGILTVSLFRYRDGDDSSHLVWYVEYDEAVDETWTDPATTIRRASPLFGDGDGGLVPLLGSNAEPRVIARGAPDADLLVHARHPERPSTLAPRTDEFPIVPSADVASDRSVDVVLLRLAVRPGLPTGFIRVLARVMALVPDEGRVEQFFEERSEPVIEAERMYTESIFLERTGGEYFLLVYMEADDMTHAWEAYFETDNRIARLSERIFRWILADPERGLSDPSAVTDYELLAHAISPDRA